MATSTTTRYECLCLSSLLRLATGTDENAQQASGAPLHPLGQEGLSPLPHCVPRPESQGPGLNPGVCSQGLLQKVGFQCARMLHGGGPQGSAYQGCSPEDTACPSLCGTAAAHLTACFVQSCAGLCPSESPPWSVSVLILMPFCCWFCS